MKIENNDMYKGYVMNGQYFNVLGYREDYPHIYFRNCSYQPSWNTMGEFYDTNDTFELVFNLLRFAA